jgi:arylsulfatase A-like enzyme
MKYILILILFTTIVACNPKSQPNVIIVITDDQGYGDLGFTGNPIIKTPNIDEFAANAVSFTNYHVGTSCSPTRAGLMTGRNCLRNGVWHTNAGCSLLNQEEETIAEAFGHAGYKTAMFGKWHLGDNYSFLPEQRGFQQTFYHKGGGVGQTPDFWNNDYMDDTYFRNGSPEKANGYCTDVFFKEAISFIKASKDVPFFCYLSLNAPHSPYNVPDQYYSIYEDESEITEIQKRFYGMITNIDENFGILRETLESLNIIDNTILIFTTDNGTAAGYRFDKKEQKWYGYNAGMRGTKASQYDGGHRVPFIMQWNKGGYRGGRNYAGLSAHVDVLPTLASLAGIPFSPKKKLDGTDLSRFIEQDKSPDRMLVTDTQRNQWPEKGQKSCVMYNNWRLVDGNELYNIDKDPGQLSNVIADNPDMAGRMQNFYNEWWEDVSAEFTYSYIDIEPGIINTITSHDVHVESITAWDQKHVRSGQAYETGVFSVNFRESGQYTISLRRWPKESGSGLSDEINDAVDAAKYWDERAKGQPMGFVSAYVIIGDAEYKLKLQANAKEAIFHVDVESGKTTLETGFYLANGEKSVAFYTDITRY